MAVHKLKIQPRYYHPVALNEKRFEIRKDDRNYQLGDLLVLNELTSAPSVPLYRAVTYISEKGSAFVLPHYRNMSIVPVDGVVFRQYELDLCDIGNKEVWWIAEDWDLEPGDTFFMSGVPVHYRVSRAFTSIPVEHLPSQARVACIREVIHHG